MARARERLAARGVQTARVPGMYLDGQGLHLRIGKAGNKSWVYRYRVNGRAHDMGLGPYPDISLAEARERAAAQRRFRLDGKDPLAVRQTGRAKAVTFEECAQRYVEAHQAGWRNARHASQWPGSLAAFVYPVFGTLPVQAIDTGLVMRALEPIWTTKPETASRVRGRIESVLDWATARGYRSGENPARWRGHLESLLPKRSKVASVEHHAALPYPEISAFMAELRRQEGGAARALEFLILTAARTGEVIGARWSEFNIAERLWIVPGERMKSGREHRVPLSDAVLAIVEKIKAGRVGDQGFVFCGRTGGKLGKAALLVAAQRTGQSNLTAHGFRSTFRDWAAERTSFPAEVAEMALAHVVTGAVERAYRRGDLFDKRRQLAEAWSRFCAMSAAAGKVVGINSADIR